MSDHRTDSRVAPFTPPHLPGERQDYRSFGGLLGTMFQGAFSDNIYKLILIMVLAGMAEAEVAAQFPGLIKSQLEAKSTALAASYQQWIHLAFTLPYIIAVSFAGWLSDRYSKTRVTQATKAMEVVIMVIATGAFLAGNVWLGVGVLFLMALQSALFSPSKYGILPEMLPASRLGFANGLLQGFTFLAIILGTIVGPMLEGMFRGQLWMAGVMLVGLAAVGFATSLTMKPVPPASPGEKLRLNPFSMVNKYGRLILADTGLTWGVMGMMCWWLVAVMIQSAAVLTARIVLDLDGVDTGLALLPLVVGIGAGCFLAGVLSKDRIELGLLPFGALGMFFTCLWVWYLMIDPRANMNPDRNIHTILIPVAMGFVGLMSGLFIVPLEAFVVHTANAKERGGIWATTNVFTAFGMIIGAVLAPLLMHQRLGGNPGYVFLFSGFFMVIVCGVICLRFPTIPLRFMILALFRSFYRTRAVGTEHIPKVGGALLTANHQSFLDGILLTAVVDRPIRFIMSREVFGRWYILPFAKLTRSIPIEQNQSPRELIASLREAAEEIREGGLVCIFPEGQLTRVGQMLPFRRGLERIMKDIHAPIIPIAIDGAWETGMALRKGKLNLPHPPRFRRPAINVAIGEPLPSVTGVAELRRRVSTLMVNAFGLRKPDCEPLQRLAVRQLRSHLFSRWYSDHSTEEAVPNLRVLSSIIILGRKLFPVWKDEKMVGIMLPPSIGAVAVNVAALLAGRVPVNLNYTASTAILDGICRQAGIRVVLTSRVFLDKAKVELPAGLEVLYLEDVRKTISGVDKLRGMLSAVFTPVAALEKSLGRSTPTKPDDLVTLIFSSGSTGTPKGVMLSHWNIWSNCVGALHYVQIDKDTRLLGILPFFHSFGYMATIWLPLVKAVGVSFFPSPLEARAIGMIVEKYKVTHMFGTPTFLNGFTRRIEPGQFGSLKFVVTGAEKLQERIAAGFEERFGIRPVEGFGCTECSPVVSINGEDWREPGIYQAGTRRGTVGRPIPGVEVRIVDLDTGEELAIGEKGMLLVRGTCVMQGYYGMEEKTSEALVNGWYRTGDIARVDEDGFLMITDRLARFSKIGGEMVPHVRIEEALHEVIGSTEQHFAVTAVPDEKKGERLAVLYVTTEEEARRACELLSGAGELDLPALWLPKWPDFIKVDEIPVLGTGKLDLQRVRATALEALTAVAK